MALKSITEDFNKKFAIVNLPVDDIRKKINSIRTQYFGEVNKIKKSQVSGAGAADVYKSNLWSFDHLQFLSNSNPIRPSVSNLNIEVINEADEESEIIFDGTIEELDLELGPESQASDSLDDVTRPSTSFSFRSEDLQTPNTRKRKRPLAEAKQASVTLMEKATSLLENNNQKEEINTIDAFLA